MICELKQYSDGQDTITQRIVLGDEPPPEGFGEFATGFTFMNPNGQPIGQAQASWNAPSVADAFVELPKMRQAALEQLTKPKIHVASPFAAENRLNGKLRLTE